MAQVRQGMDDEDKSLFLNAFANANPLSLLNFHVWDAILGQFFPQLDL